MRREGGGGGGGFLSLTVLDSVTETPLQQRGKQHLAANPPRLSSVPFSSQAFILFQVG